ncbi:glucokinase [Parvibaculum sedimenti]|uniref:Glucokinase n=1 Tax=Parvibaculum sedimenti TaxID=2608632 RepID=A0A6N6VTC0_9HYPH|nr:glucokinase [Parvibaculum sedimenti]KAB7742896.1 glucokinase [Parvibaculum sedimenti]
MSECLFLVSDIGGTNARFALARATGNDIAVDAPTVFHTVDYAALEVALAAFLDLKGRPRLDAVAVCAAGPVEGEGATARIQMTNCPWDVSVKALADATGVARPVLINDFAALARAVPELKAHELHRLGGGKADPHSPIGILGAGTGLGVAGLVPDGGRYIAIPGEGGHVDLAPTNTREIEVLAHLMRVHGRVSVERVLSGPGLVALYTTLAALDSVAVDGQPTGADISDLAAAKGSPHAVEAVSMFCGWLGSVAGNLALTLGAKGGIFIGGGIVPGWIARGRGLFDEALFRRHFEAKGRFEPYLAAIPVQVIMRGDTALLGLAHAAREAI